MPTAPTLRAATMRALKAAGIVGAAAARFGPESKIAFMAFCQSVLGVVPATEDEDEEEEVEEEEDEDRSLVLELPSSAESTCDEALWNS